MGLQRLADCATQNWAVLSRFFRFCVKLLDDRAIFCGLQNLLQLHHCALPAVAAAAPTNDGRRGGIDRFLGMPERRVRIGQSLIPGRQLVIVDRPATLVALTLRNCLVPKLDDAGGPPALATPMTGTFRRPCLTIARARGRSSCRRGRRSRRRIPGRLTGKRSSVYSPRSVDSSYAHFLDQVALPVIIEDANGRWRQGTEMLPDPNGGVRNCWSPRRFCQPNARDRPRKSVYSGHVKLQGKRGLVIAPGDATRSA